MDSIQDGFKLNNGILNPCVGFGTYKAADQKSMDIIKMAIETGYRYFDTASFYETEAYLAGAMKETGIQREELFIISKAWKTEMGYENIKKHFQRRWRDYGRNRQP